MTDAKVIRTRPTSAAGTRKRPTSTAPKRSRPVIPAGVPMSVSAMAADTTAIAAIERRIKSSRRVRYFVYESGESPAKLAESLGVSEKTFAEWSQGFVAVPNIMLATMELAFSIYMEKCAEDLADLFAQYRKFAEF